MLSLLLVGCDSNPPGDADAGLGEPCEGPGIERCVGDVAQRCVRSEGDVARWADHADCASCPELVCIEASSIARCYERLPGSVIEERACNDACEDRCFPGERRCDTDAVQTCSVRADGCWDWEDSEDCAPGRCVADPSYDLWTCAAACDECAPRNFGRCQGDVAERCLPADDGCYRWQVFEDCADVDGVPGECVPEFDGGQRPMCLCQSGREACSGTVRLLCDDDSYPPEVVAVVDCADSGQTCVQRADGATECAAR